MVHWTFYFSTRRGLHFLLHADAPQNWNVNTDAVCSLSVSVLSKVSLSHRCFSKNIIIKGRPKLRYNLGTKYCIVRLKRHKQETYLCNCKNVSKITEINVMLTKIKHSLAISSPKMFSRGGEELGTPNRYGNFKLLKFKQ